LRSGGALGPGPGRWKRRPQRDEASSRLIGSRRVSTPIIQCNNPELIFAAEAPVNIPGDIDPVSYATPPLLEDSESIGDFDFGEATAAVFDDMLDRSIPEYRELQRMIGELAATFAEPGTRVYDLGCSTGITLETLAGAIGVPVEFVGLDYSPAMLGRARERLSRLTEAGRLTLLEADLNSGVQVENASVVVLNLTLQFVRPLRRDLLIRDINRGMNPNGCLILVEKVLGNDSLFNRTFIRLYYEMKRRKGYSDTDIAHKREALENVLVPYRVDENFELLDRNGFNQADIFFKWYNFCGIVGVKGP
jgi:tRNA (cmo5U34)-methyltransferase